MARHLHLLPHIMTSWVQSGRQQRNSVIDRTAAGCASVAHQGGVRRVVLAEDDLQMRRLLATALRKDGYEVIEASNGVECIGHMQPWVLGEAQSGAPDLIISDIRMPGWTGIQILQLVRARKLPTRVILITAFGSSDTHAEVERLGAAALFDKPFDVDELRAAVRRLVPPARGEYGNP